MALIQDTIHRLEVAGGQRYVKIGLAILAIVGGTAYYNFRCFRNFGTQEAMDSAQLARNISEGKGYTTSFVRPLSMFLLRRHNEAAPKPLLRCVDCGKVFQGTPPSTCPKCKSANLVFEAPRLKDITQIDFEIRGHPDIANPPVFPILEAAIMKVLPFRHRLPDNLREFSRYQPDFLISAFNQVLFFGVIVSCFFLARRLFDPPTAWLSAALLFGADIFWRFSVSGLSTMFLLLLVTGLAWCLVLIEERSRDSDQPIIPLLVLALAAGLLCGLGALTRYSFIVMIIPLLASLTLFGGSRRWVISAICLVTFMALLLPWIVRNYHLSGTPFGVAGYAVCDGTPMFPENLLDRSFQPELTPPQNVSWGTFLTQKALQNLRHIIQTDLFTFSGGFVTAFFLVGLLVVIPNATASRLRYFILSGLLLLVLAQALGRTHLSADSPEINSENLLIFLAPLVVVFGAHFFWLLLGQVYLPLRELRYVAVGLFCFLCCLPMLFNFLPPRPYAIVPPYFPPYIRTAASFVKPDELTMCDMPWAMAWYGRVPSIWAPQGYEPLLDIDSFQKPIKALYLTSVTVNSSFFSNWLPVTDGWGYIFMELWNSPASRGQIWPKEEKLTVSRVNSPPAVFPLHYLQTGWPRECLLTTRRDPVSESQSPSK